MFKHQKKDTGEGKPLRLQFALNRNIQQLSPDEVLTVIAQLNYRFSILMNVVLKHLGSVGGLFNMYRCHGCFVLHRRHGCFTSFYILLNTSTSTGLVRMTMWRICLVVLVAVAHEKQVSTYAECLRKMNTLMRRQTTPVR